MFTKILVLVIPPKEMDINFQELALSKVIVNSQSKIFLSTT